MLLVVFFVVFVCPFGCLFGSCRCVLLGPAGGLAAHGMCMWHVRMHAYMYACFDGLMSACLTVCMIEIVVACAAYES